MSNQIHQLAAIMLAHRSFCEGGHARSPSQKAMAAGDRSFSEGGFTDIVGYTSLMGKYETSAHQLLKKANLVKRS